MLEPPSWFKGEHQKDMLKKLSLIAILASVGSLAQAAPSGSVTIPVVGSGAAGSQFNGTFKVTGFHYDSGVVYADGILTGVATTASGVTSVLQTVSSALQLPSSAAPIAAAPAASCSILNLVIGPINLNLLGLSITTDQITLNITAIPGAGNLLGNLLCDVTNLLNPSSQLASLLNQILGILGGL